MNHRSVFCTLRTLTRIVRPRDFHRNFPNNLKVLQANQDLNSSLSRQRCFTTDVESLKDISFEEVRKLAHQKNAVIIDVREPDELVTQGVIPGSVNIPLSEVKKALRDMSDDSFFRRYGHKKPDAHDTIIFSCRTGRRGKEAQILAVKLGYKNALNYLGGWTDWAEKSKSQ